MNPADIDLLGMLKRVRLPTVADVLPRFIDRAAVESWSHRDFLAAIIAEEVAHRETTRIQRSARLARFPYFKTIEEFDFTFQSSLKRSQLGPFLDVDFVANGRNLVLAGKPGLGKTHLRAALDWFVYRPEWRSFLVHVESLGPATPHDPCRLALPICVGQRVEIDCAAHQDVRG